MSNYPIANMIEQLSFIIIQQHWSSSCFTFYSVWQKGQAVSLATRSGRFESSFLTLQGKPNAHVTWLLPESHVQYFPFLSGSWIRVTHLDYKSLMPRYGTVSWPLLHPHVRACEQVQGGWGKSPLPGPIRYLSLPITIFLGMWLVRSNA